MERRRKANFASTMRHGSVVLKIKSNQNQMKNFILFCLLNGTLSVAFSRTIVTIPAMQTKELQLAQYAPQSLRLINASGQLLEVQVVNPENGKFMQGFGLGARAEATLQIPEGQVLVLKNPTTKELIVKIDVNESPLPIQEEAEGPQINFTLRNSSLRSIPLIIPGVMNPNLNPMSSSGVTLRVGQKIYLKSSQGKRLILTVDHTIQPGDQVDIAKLLLDPQE